MGSGSRREKPAEFTEFAAGCRLCRFGPILQRPIKTAWAVLKYFECEVRWVASVDVTEARDAEEQKTRNRSLAIGPLIVYPDVAG